MSVNLVIGENCCNFIVLKYTYPSGTNNALTDYTTPASILYNPNKNGKLYMSKPVTNITRNSDMTISFDFADDTDLQPEPLPEGVFFRETFDRSFGKGGNDNIWAGSADVASSYFISDNDGWVSTYKYGGDKCARFGTNTQRGIATTPEIEINGDSELLFLAAPWTGEAASVTLLVSEGAAMLAETSFKLERGKWTEYKTSLTGNGKVKIQFRSNRGRFFLDEVVIKNADTDAIKSVTTDDILSASDTTYNLNGQRVTPDTKGIVIRGGRKYVNK